jgi:solute carrier family 25 phosphate transporter 3
MTRFASLVCVAALTVVDARAFQPSRVADASAAKDEARSRQRHRRNYFAGVSLAGATACSVTHCMVVPLDVVKTRMQMDAALSAAGIVPTAAAVFRGAQGNVFMRCAAFFNGLPPTALGYFLQGATKFGGYELFKQKAFVAVRERGGEGAVHTWQLPVMLVSAAAAEMAATMLLAPLEVLKLRVQTDAASASRGALATFRHIVRHEGAGALYAGLAPIAMRQLPYTVTKLVAYELFVRATTAAARQVEGVLLPHSDGETLRPYAILFAGLVAGAAAAVVSHPADLLLTRLCGSPTAALVRGALSTRRRPARPLTLCSLLGCGRAAHPEMRWIEPRAAAEHQHCRVRDRGGLRRASQVPDLPRHRRRVRGARAAARHDLRHDEHPIRHLRRRAPWLGRRRPPTAARAGRHSSVMCMVSWYFCVLPPVGSLL